MKLSKRKAIEHAFSSVGEPAALSFDARTLLKQAKRYNTDLTLKDVQQFMQQDSHVRSVNAKLHHSASRRRYLPYATTNVNVAHSCDLMFRKSASSTAQHPILVCADNLSQKIFAQPMPNKQPTSTVRAFSKIVDQQNEGKWPSKLYVDSG